INTDPADTDPVFGPPEPIEEADEAFTLRLNEQEEGAPEEDRVANFDEAVRVADEPDTDALRVARASEPSPHTAAAEGEAVGADAEGVAVGVDGEAGEQGTDEGVAVVADRTPMGERRGITESEEIDYEPPSADKVLERGKPDKGPDKNDHEAVG